LSPSCGDLALLSKNAGNVPPMDPASNSSKYFDNEQQYLQALAFIENLEPLNSPIALRDLIPGFDVGNYVGVFVPGPSLSPPSPSPFPFPLVCLFTCNFSFFFLTGGHSPLIDLMGFVGSLRSLSFFNLISFFVAFSSPFFFLLSFVISNPGVGHLLYQFYLNDSKLMGFICHGPLVSLSSLLFVRLSLRSLISPDKYLSCCSVILAPENQAQTFPFAGRNMTVFSQPEEVVIYLLFIFIVLFFLLPFFLIYLLVHFFFFFFFFL
jgi:hypothetical protein